jgi:hypothetical protein
MGGSVMVGLIVGMGFISIATAVASKVADNFSQTSISQYIQVAGVSGAGLIAVGLAIKILNTIKGM